VSCQLLLAPVSLLIFDIVLTLQSGIKPPVTAGKRHVAGPAPVRSASAAGAASAGSGAGHAQLRSNSAGGMPSTPAATPAGVRAGSAAGAVVHPSHGTPLASMAAAPRNAAATPMPISPLAAAGSPVAVTPGLPQPAGGAAGGKAAATPAPGQPAQIPQAGTTTPGLVVAPMPHIPQGYNTPMAMIQQHVGNAVSVGCG
jgi:hypothetical protein